MNLEKIEGSFNVTTDQKCAFAEGGMVSTAFPEATRIGADILKRGGNAVDAACAAALALGVCEPQSSGIGGQTMAILHIQGRTIAVDGSSRVPSLAHISRFDGNDRTIGHRAATVPTTVAVLGYLNFRYGLLPWKSIVEPAARLARDGYRITELQSSLQRQNLDKFSRAASRSGAGYFLKNGDRPFNPGDLFIQTDLAATLETLAESGPRAFYTGDIARRIDEDMQANGGFLRSDDLALIPWPIERSPLRRRYRDITIFTIPPPAAGRTLLLVMMMLNNLPSRFVRKSSPESFHFIAETFRKAFLLRKERPYDPNTYPQVADKIMISREFARTLSRSIRYEIDPQLPLIDPPSDEADTTHLSVMDAWGNAVGITQSIELVYGSKVAAEGLGFLYNNYMMALDTKTPAHPYYLRPNAIPWTSVAPAIVFYKHEPWLVVGSPGSERIYSTVGQFLIHLRDRRCSLGEAMEQPRLHCSIGGKISLEAERFEPEVVDYLEKTGYKIDRREPFSFYLGAIHAVIRCQSRSGFQGVAEIRRDGTAGGP
ncbi:gamma-glutamyltransferase family protein [candidate division KSB1 bacterium]